MAYQFVYRKRVEFCETDMVGIVHFANFFRYMEMAEHAFYRSLGFRGFMPGKEQTEGWPRVHAEMDFVSPLVFDEEVDIRLLVAEIKRTSLSHRFIFRKGDGTLVARGKLTVVYVLVEHETGRMKAASIPAWISDNLEAAPAEILDMEEA